MISILLVEIALLIVIAGLVNYFYEEYSWLKMLSASRREKTVQRQSLSFE